MRVIDCECDDGADDNGICPCCRGIGWYLKDGIDPIEWVRRWGVY